MASDLEHQLRMTARQIEERLALDDRLDVPRPVDHSAEFKRKRDAEAAGEELRALGYSVRVDRRGLTKALLEAQRASAIDPMTAERFVREVVAVVDKHRGSYDGWGGPVEAG